MKLAPEPRQRIDELERASLSTWATLAAESKGRDRYEEADPMRTAFQVDRDRVTGCSAFGRLARTTWLPPLPARPGVTLLELTLEVWAASRAAGRALRLNEDLTETIALALWLGAPPFGRAGAAALDWEVHRFGLHSHSVRVVERLTDADFGERATARGHPGPGLNLSWEVRDGIHGCDPDAAPPATCEGQVVRAVAAIVSASRQAGPQRAGAPVPVAARHADRVRVLAGELVAAARDRPEAALPPASAAALAGLGAAADRAEATTPAEEAARRAVHCVRSLLVAALGAETPTAAQAWQAAVDDIAGLDDAGAVSRFQTSFLPPT